MLVRADEATQWQWRNRLIRRGGASPADEESAGGCDEAAG
jgi:hypothetical protein